MSIHGDLHVFVGMQDVEEIQEADDEAADVLGSLLVRREISWTVLAQLLVAFAVPLQQPGQVTACSLKHRPTH